MQCTSNAYFSIAYSLIKKPSIWKSWDSDYVIEQGDILPKSVGIGQPLAVDELPINFKTENFELNGVMLDHESHLMQGKNDFFENNRHLTCASFTVAIIWNKTSVFYLILTVVITKVFTILMEFQHLKFRSMLSLKNFHFFNKKIFKTFFIENVGVSAETQYNLQYIFRISCC